MSKALISNKYCLQADLFVRESGVDIGIKPGLSTDVLLAVIAKHNSLILKLIRKVTRAFLEKAAKFRVLRR